jgi:hypothetical protein
LEKARKKGSAEIFMEQPKAIIALLSVVVAFAVQLKHSNNNAKRLLQHSLGCSDFMMTRHGGWLV